MIAEDYKREKTAARAQEGGSLIEWAYEQAQRSESCYGLCGRNTKRRPKPAGVSACASGAKTTLLRTRMNTHDIMKISLHHQSDLTALRERREIKRMEQIIRGQKKRAKARKQRAERRD